MGNYLTEKKEYDKEGLGIEVKDAPLAVNEAGYYNEDQCSAGHSMNVSYPKGRKDYLLCYIGKGRVIAAIDGKESALQDGVLLIPPHTPYRYHSEPVDDAFEIYWLHFSGNRAEQYLRDCGLYGQQFFRTKRIEELVVTVHTIVRELTFRQPQFEFVTQSLMLYVLALAARFYQSDKYTTPNVDARMQKVAEYIYLYYGRSLTVKELADVASLSVSRFSSLFKQTFGLYPLQYIINYRLKRACDLLLHTQYSISAIAEMVGFEDPLYFSRAFKKQMGMSPSHYRRIWNPEWYAINRMKG